MILFIDCETTGFPVRGAPSDDPNHPHITEIAMVLDDDRGITQAALSTLIFPVGYEVPGETVELNGITTAMCQRYGMAQGMVLAILEEYATRADVLVAHNWFFDFKMVKIACAQSRALPIRELLETKSTLCTMNAATNICKIPGPRGYKWPSLPEACKALDINFVEKHRALPDVYGCRNVYYELKKRGVLPAPSAPKPKPAKEEAHGGAAA